MIESVFLVESICKKHRAAPLLEEREKYLTHLSEIGTNRVRVRIVAAMLLRVVQLLEMDSLRPVGLDEISQSCKRWVDDSVPCLYHRPSTASQYAFRLAAANWLRFHGALITPPKPAPLFGDLLSEFLNAMRSERGLAVETLRCYRLQILLFLSWMQSRCLDFSSVTPSHIEEYFEAKRDRWSRGSLAAHCRSLRAFFGYAEQQRWCSLGIRKSVRSPRVTRIAEDLDGPPWDDVRLIIDSIGNVKPADLRAKAMILLFSIYGFRSAEVRGMMLEDIDWRAGSITVRRAKRGKTQQFPLQCEVGEAVALYLEKARPRCHCRNVFVTLNPPYRPVSAISMISPRIKRLNIVTKQFGPHMLRRACATQLLRTGTSLKDIADFLGHSNLRSVSRYAKFDTASLTDVANFGLRGVL